MYKNGERVMAWVAKVESVIKHPNADALDICMVGGWKCVTRKDEFEPGESVVYISIDSWVPHELAPFLSKGKEPREFNGVKGERLRTIKLRNEISQGLILPVSVITQDGVNGQEYPFIEGSDVTELLGIQKYEAPIPVQLSGMARGIFPSEIPRTDQERIQNLRAEVTEAFQRKLTFTIEEKLEGTSCTFYLAKDGDFHVCSRNFSLKHDGTNTYWVIADELGIEDLMRKHDLYGYAIQGEICGPGIQGNIYGLSKPTFYVFDVYSTDTGKHLVPIHRIGLVSRLGLNTVPVLSTYSELGTDNIDELLKDADGSSKLNPKVLREGLVFKESNGGMTFKVISNEYLSRQ